MVRGTLVGALTLPLRFQVPVKIVQCFGEEYSVRLLPHQRDQTGWPAKEVPLFQRRSDRVVNRVEYRDGLLVAEIALRMNVSK